MVSAASAPTMSISMRGCVSACRRSVNMGGRGAGNGASSSIPTRPTVVHAAIPAFRARPVSMVRACRKEYRVPTEVPSVTGAASSRTIQSIVAGVALSVFGPRFVTVGAAVTRLLTRHVKSGLRRWPVPSALLEISFVETSVWIREVIRPTAGHVVSSALRTSTAMARCVCQTRT